MGVLDDGSWGNTGVEHRDVVEQLQAASVCEKDIKADKIYSVIEGHARDRHTEQLAVGAVCYKSGEVGVQARFHANHTEAIYVHCYAKGA